jgi:D-beta-D-heptose 7-phosphate kinase/D-beta-D-heptose 1-phosphate adenosyltransferase
MAWNVRENLMSFGMEVFILTNKESITKTRYIDEKSNQHILRVDEEGLCDPMDYELPEDEYDALVISDYDKGFLTEEKIFELVEWFDGPVFIDSKKPKLPKKSCYVKINEDEYNKLDKPSKNLIVTKGGKGAEYRGKLYSGEQVKVFDAVGAGDTFLSSLVYFYLVCGRIENAIPYANRAASIAVQNFGTYVLTEKDVKNLRD